MRVSRPVAAVLIGVAALTVVEIIVLVAVGHAIGALPTLLLVLGVSLLGVFAVRRVGGRAWREVLAALADGRAPGRSTSDGLLALAGGVLLALPGFVTDVAGLALLSPPGRALLRRPVERRIARRLGPDRAGAVFGASRVRVRQGTPYDRGPSGGGAVVDGEIIEG